MGVSTPARTLPSSYEWVLCTHWAYAHRASRQPQSLSVGTRWCDCGVLVRVKKGIQQSSPRSFVSHSLAQMLRPLVLILGGFGSYQDLRVGGLQPLAI